MSGLYILICSLTACHYTSCPPQQNKVQPHGPVMNIPVIHLHSFRIIHVISPAGLPDTGNAGTHHGILFEIHAVSWNLLLYDRPGSHEAHFPFQHVPELRQFVQPLLVMRGAFFSLNSLSHSSFAAGSVARRWSKTSCEFVHMERNL